MKVILTFDRLSLLFSLFAYNIHRVLRAYPIKDPVASNQDEIQIAADRNGKNVRIGNYTFGVAPILLHFRHAVTECARN